MKTRWNFPAVHCRLEYEPMRRFWALLLFPEGVAEARDDVGVITERV